MIAIDTNILIYAHRAESSLHKEVDRHFTELAASGNPWAIPWPCLHEFLAIVTHPKIYNPPTPLAEAILQIESWLKSPSLHLIGETEGYWPFLKDQLISTKFTGPRVHDVKIAAVCLQHDVKILWSADRDFSRIKGLKVFNPLFSH